MVVAVLEQPPVIMGPVELAWFVAANVIIFYICFGPLWKDIKRWTRRSP